ncbi:MAG TPA: RodZ domain-containing protein [Acidimicrobiales bacterium]|nr:RodZ domain-containing protein [Acidimicrobiales bacterium]
MIAFAAVAVLVVVVVGVAISRFTASRAERRSLDTYERTLDLLGDVAKRSDAVADVHAPSKDELARPHVRPALGRPLAPPPGSAVRIVPPARTRVEPQQLPGRPPGALPVFGDPDLVAGALAAPAVGPAEPPPPPAPDAARPFAALPPADVPGSADGPPVFDFDDVDPAAGDEVVVDGEPAGHLRLARTGGHVHGMDRRVRRATARAAAAVALVALGVGGWQLESHSGPPVASSPPQPTTPTTAPARASGVATPGTTTPPPVHRARPAALRPTSTSATLVTYVAPSGPYTVTFTAVGGTCWLGAQQQVASSSYLQMWTLTSGQRASYQANGPLVVKIGAPRYVTIAVDGEPVVLPPGNVQPYDISFTTGSGTPA